jgi:radical SAM protein with 4Fe4S-binding SPASM domain
VNLDLKTVITNQNVHEFWDLKALIESLGCEFRYDPLVNPRINGSKRPAGERVTPDSVVALELALEEVAEDQRQYLHKAEPFESDSVFKCGAGINTFHIDPYGNLMTCMMVHTHSFNLRRGSFREGFEEYFPTVIGRRSPKVTRCYSCGLATSCDRCPGWSTLEHADLEEPVDFLCDVTHERAAAYGALSSRETLRTRAGASAPVPLQPLTATASMPRVPEAFAPLAGVRPAAEVAA